MILNGCMYILRSQHMKLVVLRDFHTEAKEGVAVFCFCACCKETFIETMRLIFFFFFLKPSDTQLDLVLPQ